MLTIIVSGRNDDYGRDFRERLFRTALHNSSLLSAAEIDFEYILAEWNPLPDRPPLSREFVARVPNARAVIVAPEIHQKYSLNPHMSFHEMAAKNAGIRRAGGDCVIVTNADILFSETLVCRIAAGNLGADTLYRAHRIDVKAELDWTEIQNPANQLASGEGTLTPPYYVGAGGDFCLAARSLWHSLRGFNEQIRFSTRAKDWQFFLSAAAQGVEIEFIGDVYHLDHEGGFRNTAESNAGAVHFGRWWDIEFGLPVTNCDDWGFYGLSEEADEYDPRITKLDSKDYVVADAQNEIDRTMMTWLTRTPGSPDTDSAVLLHAICAAHREGRRLFCRIRDGRLATTLSGFDAVGSRFGVEIFCNWTWPLTSGYSPCPFNLEPTERKDSDWIVKESDTGIQIYEYGSRRKIDVLPTLAPVNGPEFNPVLSRRLLRAFLELQKEGASKIAICGAGSHTKSLLQWGLPDNIELVGIFESGEFSGELDSPPDSGGESERSEGGVVTQAETVRCERRLRHFGGPRQPLIDAAASLPQEEGSISSCDKTIIPVLLSSSSFESDMLETCKLNGIRNVIALYGDWPRDMWAARALTAEQLSVRQSQR